MASEDVTSLKDHFFSAGELPAESLWIFGPRVRFSGDVQTQKRKSTVAVSDGDHASSRISSGGEDIICTRQREQTAKRLRVFDIVVKTLSFSFSWCCLFSCSWSLEKSWNLYPAG